VDHRRKHEIRFEWPNRRAACSFDVPGSRNEKRRIRERLSEGISKHLVDPDPNFSRKHNTLAGSRQRKRFTGISAALEAEGANHSGRRHQVTAEIAVLGD
jgi:hypothetical protein